MGRIVNALLGSTFVYNIWLLGRAGERKKALITL
jgi:hypothetical protein